MLKSALNNRFVTVAAGAVVIGLIGAGAGYSAATITSAQIANDTIRSKDVKDGNLKAKDLSKKTLAELKGAQGPQGPAGPAGGSNVTQVTDLNGQWKARATDVAGVKMDGDGIQFGPYANAGQCSTDGVDYGRLDFSGMNGKPLSSLTNLVYSARYIADNDTGGVGSPTVRVFFSGTGTGGDGVPNEPNRLTFSPNTQFNNPLNYDFAQGAVHEWLVTSGTVRYNDDGDSSPAGEKAWDTWVAQFPGATISNINVLSGCSNGTNLTTHLREFEVNGQHYEFGTN